MITAWLWHSCRISGKDNTAKYPWYHSTVLVDGHLYDTGRMTTSCTKEAIERVVAYDLIKNEMMSCPSLRKPGFEICTQTGLGSDGHDLIL